MPSRPVPGEFAKAAISTGATRCIVCQRSRGSSASWLTFTCVPAVLHIIQVPALPWAAKNASIAA